jgi:hypothetical protein
VLVSHLSRAGEKEGGEEKKRKEKKKKICLQLALPEGLAKFISPNATCGGSRVF